MASMVLKIVDRSKPDMVARATGELIGAGYSIEFQDEADLMGVDAQKHGGDEQTYAGAVLIIGKK